MTQQDLANVHNQLAKGSQIKIPLGWRGSHIGIPNRVWLDGDRIYVQFNVNGQRLVRDDEQWEWA